jgi:hypothetical protein
MASTPEQRAAKAAYMRQYRQQNLEQERERDRAKHQRRRLDPLWVERRRQSVNQQAKARRGDPARPDCSIDGCTNKAATAGMCNSHYLRQRRHGDPLAGRANQLTGSLADRLWPRIQVGSADECWPWTAALNASGYGVISKGATGSGPVRNALAYRAAWELTNGPVPDGLELDHLCRNPVCCNPAHLEPVTHEENMRRAMRTHCIHGHEFTEVNTRWQKLPNGRFSRVCLICRDRRQRLRYATIKAQRVTSSES